MAFSSQDLIGVWRRKVEEEPIGSLVDDTTRTVNLATLTARKSFAGNGVLEGSKFTWHRWIDFQPPAGADVGILEWLDADKTLLQEDGEDGSYREIWVKVPSKSAGALGTSVGALELVHPTRRGVWVVAAGQFMRAVSRDLQEGSAGFKLAAEGTGDLKQRLPSLALDEQACEQVVTDYTAVYGDVEADGYRVVMAMNGQGEGELWPGRLERRGELLVETHPDTKEELSWRIHETHGDPFFLKPE